MLKLSTFFLAALVVISCRSKNDSSSGLQDLESPAPSEQPSAQEKVNNTGTPSDFDQQVYAFLYSQQSLHSTEDYLLPNKFDAMAFVQALLEVQNGLAFDEDDTLADLLRVAVSEEVLRAGADMIMVSADTNSDGKIDYDEFMSFRIGTWQPTPALDENIHTWRQAAFPIVAGIDFKIDQDELLALLVMQREYVQRLRADPEVFQKLIQATRDQFLHNFDDDGDGSLSKEELEEIRAAALEERDRYLERVTTLCADEENQEEPICRLDATLSESCAAAEEGTLMAKFCSAVLKKRD